MTQTTEADFLHAIRETPEDDVVRLIFADWLEDHDRLAQAEFIRLQIATDGRDRDDPEVADAFERELKLLNEHVRAWRASLPILPDSLTWQQFRRGFVEGVSAQWGPELSEHAEVILDAIPLRRLHLRRWLPGHSLAGSPLLRAVRELSLHPGRTAGEAEPVDDAALAEVLTWPETRQITHLSVMGLSLSTEGLARWTQADLPALTHFAYHREYWSQGTPPLHAARWLGQLISLDLKGHAASGEVLRELVQNLTGRRLRRLGLRYASLTDDDAILLAESGLLANLERLDLERNRIGAEGLREILRVLPPTARLLLAGNPIDDESLGLLAESPHLLRLGSVPTGPFSDAGVQAIAASPFARNLRGIHVGHRRLTSAAAESLVKSPHLVSLCEMTLSGNQIGILLGCEHPHLRTLDLANNQLTDDGLAAFCLNSRLPSLVKLNLAENRLGSRAAELLANAPGFPALAELNLEANAVGDKGAIALLTDPGLPSLERLNVEDCCITDATLRVWIDSPRLARMKKILLQSNGNSIDPRVYTQFAERAHQLGCEVDSWKYLPRLRPIRRPANGSPLPASERRELVRWLQRLWFREYATVGWLKAATLAELKADHETPAALRAYFLDEWISQNTPESMSSPIDTSRPLEEISRAEARLQIDEILERSLEARDSEVTGLPLQFVVGLDAPAAEFVVLGSVEKQPIDYSSLRTWFLEDLFDANAIKFYTAPECARPSVLAMDNDVIALFWLE